MKPPHFKTRTTYSNQTKAFVVYLRFGSLTAEGPPQQSMAQIRDITGVKLVSCYSIIRDWRRKGLVISNGKLGVCRRRKVTVELEQQLINPKMLTEMAPHSFESRVLLIEQRFGVKISAHHLWEVYRRNKVRFVKP